MRCKIRLPDRKTYDKALSLLSPRHAPGGDSGTLTLTAELAHGDLWPLAMLDLGAKIRKTPERRAA